MRLFVPQRDERGSRLPLWNSGGCATSVQARPTLATDIRAQHSGCLTGRGKQRKLLACQSRTLSSKVTLTVKPNLWLNHCKYVLNSGPASQRVRSWMRVVLMGLELSSLKCSRQPQKGKFPRPNDVSRVSNCTRDLLTLMFTQCFASGSLTIYFTHSHRTSEEYHFCRWRITRVLSLQ